MEQEDLNKEIPLQMELLLKHNHLYRIINRKRKKNLRNHQSKNFR